MESLEITVVRREDDQPVYQTNINPITYSSSNTTGINKCPLKKVPGAFMLYNVLSQGECKQLIDFSEKLGKVTH